MRVSANDFVAVAHFLQGLQQPRDTLRNSLKTNSPPALPPCFNGGLDVKALKRYIEQHTIETID